MLRRLRITLALRSDARSKAIRGWTLLWIVAIGFAAAGAVRVFTPMGLLAQSPFNLDLALRTLSAGWFQPEDVVPVAIVEIDEATHRGWGSPAITPREPLVELIRKVVDAGPAAVVVDIDLAWGGDDPGLAGLRGFLAGYAGAAPLIFPKRIEPGPGGSRRAATSPLDDLFESNPRLAWAHASFETESGGMVRQWADWIELCTDDGTRQLPSVATRVSLLVEPLPAGLSRTAPPPLAGDCRRGSDPPPRLLLIGPRMSGPAAGMLSADAAAVSAAALLDPELDRDDAWLFGDRVVFIGATHAASGDFWLTPSGVLPGVELLAHTVRLSPLGAARGAGADAALRVAVLAGFLAFAIASLKLRGLAMAFAFVVTGLLYVSLPIWLFGYYRIFEALELAVLLFVFYKFLQAALDMADDWKSQRARHGPGWRGRLRTAWAACRKPDGGGSDDD